MAEYLATLFRPAGFRSGYFSHPGSRQGALHRAPPGGWFEENPFCWRRHADVVGVEREKWSVDPFAGVVKDGLHHGTRRDRLQRRHCRLRASRQ